jgi:hypothetical protein
MDRTERAIRGLSSTSHHSDQNNVHAKTSDSAIEDFHDQLERKVMLRFSKTDE